MLIRIATNLPGWASSDADKIRPPTLAALFAGSTKTVPIARSQAARQRRAAEVAPFTQPPPGGLVPCLLVEVFQNARALWRQCDLFSDRLSPGRSAGPSAI